MLKIFGDGFNLNAKVWNRAITLGFTIALAIGLSAPAVARIECVAMGSNCDQPCPDCPKRELPQSPAVKAVCCEMLAAPACQPGEARERKVFPNTPPSQLNRPLLR